MNENLQQTVNEALKALLSSVQQGAAFAKEQMPIVVQEKLAFDFWMNVLVLILFLALGIAGGLWLKFCLKKAQVLSQAYKQSQDWQDRRAAEGWTIGGSIPFACASFISFIVSIVAVRDILMITLAPHLYILEWLRGMIK